MISEDTVLKYELSVSSSCGHGGELPVRLHKRAEG
jgi:hypothetical protein